MRRFFLLFILGFLGCSENRDALAKALPGGLKLEEQFRNDQGEKTTVEKTLRGLRAYVDEKGQLRSGQGKLIFFFKGLHYMGEKPSLEMEDQDRKERENYQKTGILIEMRPTYHPK